MHSTFFCPHHKYPGPYLQVQIHSTREIIQKVPAWAKGFDQYTLVFSMIGVTGLIPQFRNPENFWKGGLECSGPIAVADSHANR